MVMVLEVAEADAHVVMDVVGDGDREAHAEDAVRESQRVEVAIAQEEQAGDRTPNQGERDQNGVRDVGDGEEHGGERDGRSAAHPETKEAQQDVNLQDELLHQRPERVSRNVDDDGQGAVKRVHCVEMMGERDGTEENGDGGGSDPQRGQESAESEAVRRCLFAAQECGDGDPCEGDPVEDALGGIRRPEDDEDQAVADGELGEVADARGETHVHRFRLRETCYWVSLSHCSGSMCA